VFQAGQILIPLLTGKAIDAVAFSGTVDGNKEFERYIIQLSVASVVTGVRTHIPAKS